MTVQELIDYLEKMPKNALVMLRHDLVGNEHEAVVVEYDEKSNTATLWEIC